MTSPSTEERLARLAARRTAHAGGPTAPPLGAVPTPAPAPATAVGRAKRRHAAKGSRATALMLSVTTTVGLAGYFKELSAAAEPATVSTAGASAAAAAPATSAAAATAATAAAATATNTAAAAPTTAATAATATDAVAATTAAPTTTAAATVNASGLADGTYTGATDTNRWGPVQVQITVAGGTISAVDVLQVPDSNSKDRAINNRAVPVLVQSTLQAQSADIDTVSGATYTSDSYKVSLQSAIDAARAAASA